MTTTVRLSGEASVAETRKISLQLPGIILGVGLGGFLDGIVLYQLLQWHHMLTSTDSDRLGLDYYRRTPFMVWRSTWFGTGCSTRSRGSPCSLGLESYTTG